MSFHRKEMLSFSIVALEWLLTSSTLFFFSSLLLASLSCFFWVVVHELLLWVDLLYLSSKLILYTFHNCLMLKQTLFGVKTPIFFHDAAIQDTITLLASIGAWISSTVAAVPYGIGKREGTVFCVPRKSPERTEGFPRLGECSIQDIFGTAPFARNSTCSTGQEIVRRTYNKNAAYSVALVLNLL